MEKLLAGVGVGVVARTTQGDEAVRLVEEHRPDLLIAGVDVSCADEMACVARATQAHPDLRAVVVDDNTNPEAIDGAFAAGATVYCVKTAPQDDFSSAIRQVFERSIYLASDGRPAATTRPAAPTDPGVRDLTRRELEILRLVAEGYSNSQLAKMLWVTEQTVKFHLSNIYRKLDVANRTEASRWAQVNGLLPSHRGAELAPAAA